MVSHPKERTKIEGVWEQGAEEETGHWRKLHSEELHNLDFFSNIIWAIKPRMRQAEHAACMA
jgi:hypothetical protein